MFASAVLNARGPVASRCAMGCLLWLFVLCAGVAEGLDANSSTSGLPNDPGAAAKAKLMVVFARSAQEENENEAPRTMLLFDDLQIDRQSDVPEEPSKELLPPHQEHHNGHARGYADHRPQRPQQDHVQSAAGYDYAKPQQEDFKPAAGYDYSKPQQDATGYSYPKPQQDDVKPSAGYDYPRPQQDVVKPSAGYDYPRPQQDVVKPSAGYDYPRPQQDVVKPSAGYDYPRPQQDVVKPSAGYDYPRPQQDDAQPSAGYDYPRPQQDAAQPSAGYYYPKPQQDYSHSPSQSLTWQPLSDTSVPSKGQVTPPPYGATLGVVHAPNGLATTQTTQGPFDDRPFDSSHRPEYLTGSKATERPALQDELPFSSGQNNYLPPNQPQNEVPLNSYIPPKSPPRDEVPLHSYLPPKQPQYNEPLNSYIPPKSPPRDDVPLNTYVPPKQPQNDVPANSYIPPKSPPRDDVPLNSYLPPKQPQYDVPLNSYIPPKSPPRDDVPLNTYVPPKQPQNDVPANSYIPPKSPPRNDVPLHSYLPPKQPQNDVPLNSYIPPKLPLEDEFPPKRPFTIDPTAAYLPPLHQDDDRGQHEDGVKAAQPRHLSSVLRAGSADEHGIRVTDMSCLRTTRRSRFTATITSPTFVPWPPVLEAVAGAAPTGCRIIADPADPHHRFLVDLSNPDLTRCGVKGCSADGEPRLCSRVVLPTVPGLRLASDPVLLLQCALQPASVSLLQQARISAAQPASGRSAGVVHAGGERAPLHAQLQLYRRGASGEFSRPMQSSGAGAVHLGEDLQLRAVVRRGDGWQSTRLSDVVVRRGADAVHLMGADGCTNPSMAAVCPRAQTWLPGEPLVSLLDMKVFMFRGMRDGDQLLLTARVVACLDRSDCNVDTCEAAGRSARTKRSSRHMNATTMTFEDSVAFVVHLDGASRSNTLNSKKPTSTVQDLYNLRLQLITMAAVILAVALPLMILLCCWFRRPKLGDRETYGDKTLPVMASNDIF